MTAPKYDLTTISFRILKGLPPYGPPARPIPEEFGRTGREGFVVAFDSHGSDNWVGNFSPGMSGYSGVLGLPQSNNLVVVAGGHAYIVDPQERTLVEDEDWIADDPWEVSDPDGFVINRQGLAFFRLGPGGVLWHTRRLSLDGFRELEISATHLRGLANVVGAWAPFKVDILTGTSQGGWQDPSKTFDDWERLSTD